MRVLIPCVCVLAAWMAPAIASAQPPGPDAPLEALIASIESALASGDPDQYRALLYRGADRERADNFTATEILPGATRVVVRPRAIEPADDSSLLAAQLVVVDAFAEFGDRARVATWIVRAVYTVDGWRISAQDRLTSLENLFRLSLDASRRFRARNFVVTAEDLELRLVNGHVYLVNADEDLTGLLLIGHGEMRFRPDPATERRQVEILAGSETLETRFDTAFIRAADIDRHADRSDLEEVPIEERELQRAQAVFALESVKTYVLNLGDLTGDSWTIVPAAGDFVAEVDTRRFDTLTYVRTVSEPEDIMLFDRRNQRTISSYRSRERLASEGRFFSEDATAQYEVLDLDVETVFYPEPPRIDGRTRMRIRTLTNLGGQLTVRLADSLNVQAVESDEFGPLLSLRAMGQNLVVVNLPGTVLSGNVFTLTLTYGGVLSPQALDRETIQMDRGSDDVEAEAAFLYSNRSFWYAQNPVGGYSPARIRVLVPAPLSVVASGAPVPGSPREVDVPPGEPPWNAFEFVAERPVRYLAFLAGRFTRVNRVTLALGADGRPEAVNASASEPSALPPPAMSGIVRDSMSLAVEAHPAHAINGRRFIDRTAEIVRFYHSLIGDAPYSSFTLALIENPRPGGHSPAHFATLNQQRPTSQPPWRSDPVSFLNFPDFYLAHEVAHQWWGQGVGWQNYHEQWLSEGIASYFAALWAERTHGPQVFGDVLRQMRQWAIDRSDQGPIYLGYRLGLIRNDGRVFRALVYNKSAAVLHMLRRFVGDEAFFRGLRRFYGAARYRCVGTEDLRYAMELESERSLERFFERWIHEAAIPEIRYAWQVRSAPVHEVRVRIEQVGDQLFDLPVTLTLEFNDRSTRDIVVPVSEATTEMQVPLERPLRSIRMSERDGTLARARRVSY